MSRIVFCQLSCSNHLASSYFSGLAALPHRNLRPSCHGSTACCKAIETPQEPCAKQANNGSGRPCIQIMSLQGGHTCPHRACHCILCVLLPGLSAASSAS
ncbi:hypothetical protein CGRA01v4_00668 [Colletotrichum graminicola]|nr:hypothetical protein CGRA01v4_00668 [Colletotrichum graminicola]